MHCSRLPLSEPRNHPSRRRMECRILAQRCQLSLNRLPLCSRRIQSGNVADGVCLVNLQLLLRDPGRAPFSLQRPESLLGSEPLQGGHPENRSPEGCCSWDRGPGCGWSPNPRGLCVLEQSIRLRASGSLGARVYLRQHPPAGCPRIRGGAAQAAKPYRDRPYRVRANRVWANRVWEDKRRRALTNHA